MTEQEQRGGWKSDEQSLQELLEEVTRLREHMRLVSRYVDMLGRRIEDVLNDPLLGEKRPR